ncbi:MAG: helix-turn-helix transcriptional regulator [Actinomycetota bacterium]|nr:helix-turn-helix transcriptional regulator [Actinomycetota bacterium]
MTARQDDVLCGIQRGLAYTEIAAELQISVSTVRSHVLSARRALDATSRTELLWAYTQTKVPEAAEIMHLKAPSLSVVAWRDVIGQVLDALNEARAT